jgi:hypothetical protein
MRSILFADGKPTNDVLNLVLYLSLLMLFRIVVEVDGTRLSLPCHPIFLSPLILICQEP